MARRLAVRQYCTWRNQRDYQQLKKLGRTRASPEQALLCNRPARNRLGRPLLFTGEFELAIMIEVVDRTDAGSDLDPDLQLIESEPWSGTKLFTWAKWPSLRSARASMLKKELDTAGIVRNA